MISNTLWIGWRLLTGRGLGLRQVGLIAVGVAVASSFLFAMASIPAAVTDRQARDAQREWLASGEMTDDAEAGMIAIGQDRLGDRAVTHLLIATGTGPFLVGFDPVPAGSVLVSPALARELESNPSLAGRLSGDVAGLLPESFLLEPSELISVSFVEPVQLLATGEAHLLPAAPPPNRDIEISSDVVFVASVALLVLALPVALFISAATRFGLEQRRQRIRVLSLVGAERRQIRLFIVLETLSSAIVGIIGGFVIFWSIRPLLSLLPVGGRSSFPSSLWPSLPLALAVVGFVLVAAFFASLAGSRRLVEEPMKASTRRARSVPGMVILGIGLAGLAMGMIAPSQTDAPHPFALIGMVLTAIGLALTARMSTAMMGRWLASRTDNGPALLAARRMDRSPDEVNRPLIAVVTGVFVVSAFFTITGTLLRSSDFRNHDLAATVVVIEASRDVLLQVADQIVGELGVEGVVVEGLVAVNSPAWNSPRLGVVASCDALKGVLEIDNCDSGVVMAVGDTVTAGSTLIVGSAPPLADSATETSVTFGGATFEGDYPASVIIDPGALDVRFLSALSESRAVVSFDPAVGNLEDLRTMVVSSAPMANVRMVAEIEYDQSSPAREVRSLALVGLGLIFIVAAFSLTVGIGSHLLQQRNAYAFLRAGGFLPSQVRTLVGLETAVPLAASAAVGALVGIAAGAAVAWSANSDPSVPWRSIGMIYMASLVVGVVVWLGFAPTLDRLTSPEGLRFE